MGIAITKKEAAGIANPGFAEISAGETARDGFYASEESVARDRPSGVLCDHCGLEFEEGYRPDPCLGGYLPGVASACCGHGVLDEAVITVGDDALPDQVVEDLVNLRYLRGEEALEFFDRHGVGPRRLPA